MKWLLRAGIASITIQLIQPATACLDAAVCNMVQRQLTSLIVQKPQHLSGIVLALLIHDKRPIDGAKVTKQQRGSAVGQTSIVQSASHSCPVFSRTWDICGIFSAAFFDTYVEGAVLGNASEGNAYVEESTAHVHKNS